MNRLDIVKNRRLLFYVTTVSIAYGVALFLVFKNVRFLLKPVPLLCVVSPSLALLIFTLGVRGLFAFVRRLFSGETTLEDTLMIRKVIRVGFLGAAIGVIHGISHIFLHLTNSDAMGEGTAIAFVSLLLALIPAVLFEIERGD